MATLARSEISPDYPALENCLIVDSRHGSRKKLISDLSATMLFKNLIEPVNVADAIKILRSETVDLGIIGPSLSADSGLGFLQIGPQVSKSKDTAFLGITANPEVTQKLQSSGLLHGILSTPYSKAAFLESVIRSVVAANNNSPWKEYLIGTKVTPRSPAGAEAPSGIETPAVPAIEIASPGPQKRNVLYDEILTASVQTLKDILTGIHAGLYTMDSTGSLSPETSRAVHRVIDVIFDSLVTRGKVDIGTLPVDFRPLLQEIFFDWVSDVFRSGQVVAVERLRSRLLHLNR